MKAEDLVTRQFQEAKVAWKAQKVALEAEIIRLKELAVGKAIGSVQSKLAGEKPVPRTLEPGLKTAKKEPAKKASKK